MAYAKAQVHDPLLAVTSREDRAASGENSRIGKTYITPLTEILTFAALA